jgi:uncharacterized membrane protein YdbT with pleckstrin-like domain
VVEQPLALLPGERVVLSSHPHWWYFWKYVVALLVVILVFVLGVWADGGMATFLLWVALAGIVVVAMATAVQFLQWRTTTFAVTDKRVAYQSGLVSRRGVSIPLNRVNNVNFHQGVIARLLNNGTVTIESAGETGESVFSNIPDPQHVRQIIFTQLEADEVGDSRRDAEAIASALRSGSTTAPPAAPGDAAARLQQLEDLRAGGLVSEQEYQAKRNEILGDL